MTTEYQLTPDRVVWNGPEGSEVVMDEDDDDLIDVPF